MRYLHSDRTFIWHPYLSNPASPSNASPLPLAEPQQPRVTQLLPLPSSLFQVLLHSLWLLHRQTTGPSLHSGAENTSVKCKAKLGSDFPNPPTWPQAPGKIPGR